MKTTFLAKIIYETESLVDDAPPYPEGEKFTLIRMRDRVNNADNDISIECILGYYTDDLQPVFIIREEKKEK